jgi:hypothetical protein
MVLGSGVGAEPHNFYFSTLSRMGLVGMHWLIALTSRVLRALRRIPTRRGGLLEPGLFPALLTVQLIWFIAWVPGMDQGIVTALAASLVARGVRWTSGLSLRGPMEDPGHLYRRPAPGRHDHRPRTGRIGPASGFPPESADVRSRPAHML